MDAPYLMLQGDIDGIGVLKEREFKRILKQLKVIHPFSLSPLIRLSSNVVSTETLGSTMVLADTVDVARRSYLW